MRAVRAALLVGGVMLLGHSPSGAQSLGLDLQATTLIQAGGIRLLGMGGLSASLPDGANIRNPAAMVYTMPREKEGLIGEFVRRKPERKDSYTALYGFVDRDTGAVQRLYSLTATRLEPERAALGVRYLRLRSNRYPFVLPGPQNVERQDEADLLLFSYGQEVLPRTALGITLVRGTNHVRFFVPGGPPSARLDIETEIGADLSLYHQTKRGIRLGALFSHRNTEEDFRNFLGPSPPANRFGIRFYRLGASYDPWRSLTLAVEYGGLRLEDKRARRFTYDVRWYYGGEYRFPRGLALRVGSFGNQFAAGLGYRTPTGWQVDYAYVNDVNRKSAESIVGQPMPGSDTHFLSLQWLY